MEKITGGGLVEGAMLCPREARRRKNSLRAEKRKLLGLPRYTLGEEIFSSVSHGVSALFAVGALVFLLLTCRRTPLCLTAAAVYGGTMVLLYTVSTLYHGLGLNRAKVVFRSLDHCTIFLLIAGTYTPITLVCLGGWKGWALFGLVWAAAALGVVLNAVSVERFKKVSMACYLLMGWVILLAMGDFIEAAPPLAFWCLLAGGVLYTVGAVLYGVGKKVPYMHAVFHLFVLGGSVLHTVSVWSILQ